MLKIQQIGAKDVRRAFKRLPEFAKAQAQQTIDVTAFQLMRGAQQRAPQRAIDGGTLRRSLTWQSRPRSLSAVLQIRDVAYYWKYLEYGTVHMAARPFLRPSAEGLVNSHASRMEQALKRALTRMEQEAT